MKVYQFFITISFFIVAYFVNFNIAYPPGTSNQFPRVGASGKCNHANVTFGRRVFGDWVSYSEEFRKSKAWFTKTTVEAQYPKKGNGPCNITMINVENLYKGCDCYNEKISLKSGGVGMKSMKLKIKSDVRCPNEHKVTCYVKC